MAFSKLQNGATLTSSIFRTCSKPPKETSQQLAVILHFTRLPHARRPLIYLASPAFHLDAKVEEEKGRGQELPHCCSRWGEGRRLLWGAVRLSFRLCRRQRSGLLMNLTPYDLSSLWAPYELSSLNSSRELSPMPSTAWHCEICRVVAK